jgi:trigger factor
MMKTTVEKAEDNKLRLEIEATADEVRPHRQHALERLAKEANIPGFRKGKVPGAIVESRLGAEAVQEEVLRDALPAFYAQAVTEENVTPVGHPDIEVTSFDDSGLTFNATIEVMPEIELPAYKGLEVERPGTEVSDEEVEEQLEALRERFGTLEPIGRKAVDGDYVTIDLSGYRHDEKIDEASAQDLVYEVGSGSIVPELDPELEGTRPGDILKLNATLPETLDPPHGGQEISFTVVVKEVQAKKLPELDDEFAKTASEFDTLEELRAEIRNQVQATKDLEAEVETRNRLMETLIERTDLTPPEAMVAEEAQVRISRLLRDLEGAGVTLEQYLEANQATQEQLVEAYREAAGKSVAADLILDAIAEKEGLQVEAEELERDIERLAQGLEQEVDEVRRELQESGRVALLAGDILRRKALKLVTDEAKTHETAS